MSLRQDLDRAGGQLVASTGRSIRLGIDGDDVMTGFQQGGQMAGRKVRCAGKDELGCVQEETLGVVTIETAELGQLLA